jgi:hypothetical protein
MKEVLYQLLSTRYGNRLVPLKLRDCVRDILITARDLNRNETTLFTAFHIPHMTDTPPNDPVVRVSAVSARMHASAARARIEDEQPYRGEVIDVVTGLYQDVLL